MSELDGRMAVVTGSGSELGRAVAAALAGAGAVVRPLAGELHTRRGAQLAIDGIVSKLGRLHVVVHAEVAPVGLAPSRLVDVDDSTWAAVWERSMRTALFVAQAAHRHLAGHDGRLIFVIPTIALSGAGGLVAYATALEGQRLLAKSAARQWGRDGITVNCVAPSAVAMGVDPDALPATALSGPALADASEAGRDLGDIIAFLASTKSRFLTGATLAVDGGTWMAP